MTETCRKLSYKKEPRAKEKGSMALILTLTVAGVSAVFLSQMATVYKSVNSLHTKNRRSAEASQHLKNLAIQFNQAYVAGQLDSSCSSAGYHRRVINGVVFCLTDPSSFCVVSRRQSLLGPGEETVRSCTSLDVNTLRWSATGTGALPVPPGLPLNSGASGTRNRIQVPSVGSRLWKSCIPSPPSSPPSATTSTCIRIALCRPGAMNCNVDNAISFQKVRFGPI